MGAAGKRKGKNGKGTSTSLVRSELHTQFGSFPASLRIPQALRHRHHRPKEVGNAFPKIWRHDTTPARTNIVFEEVDTEVGLIPSLE